MGEFDGFLIQGIHVHAETVVLRSDFDFAGAGLLHGLVGASMAEFELVGFATQCEAKELVAQTNAKCGAFLDECFDVLDGISDRFWIAGAVGEKDAVGVNFEQLVGGCVGGKDGDVAAAIHEITQNVLFDAKVCIWHFSEAV